MPYFQNFEQFIYLISYYKYYFTVSRLNIPILNKIDFNY